MDKSLKFDYRVCELLQGGDESWKNQARYGEV